MLTNYQVDENTLVQVLHTGDVIQEVRMTEKDFELIAKELEQE